MTLVLLWTFAMAGDIMGYDSWGLLMTSQWVEVKEAAEYSNPARCQGAPSLYKKNMQFRYLYCQGGDTVPETDVLIGRCVARAVWMAPE